MTLFAAIFASFVPGGSAQEELPAIAPYWTRRGCPHGHPSTVAYRSVRSLIHNFNPYVDRRKVRHYIRCVDTRAKSMEVRRRAKDHFAWRRTYQPYWRIQFNKLSLADQQWAHITGNCESGNNPGTATGNGFYGAHQWLPSTWAAADHTGIWVTNASYHHQAVVAVRWRNIEGSSQWPNCAPW